MEKDECQEQQCRQEDVKHQPQKQRLSCVTMQRFVSQPHIEQRRKEEGSMVMMVITHMLRQMAKRSQTD